MKEGIVTHILCRGHFIVRAQHVDLISCTKLGGLDDCYLPQSATQPHISDQLESYKDVSISGDKLGTQMNLS